MLKDLADRNVDQRLFSSILDFMTESFNISLEKPNLVRVIHSLLKDSIKQDTPYYKLLSDHLVGKLIQSELGKL